MTQDLAVGALKNSIKNSGTVYVQLIRRTNASAYYRIYMVAQDRIVDITTKVADALGLRCKDCVNYFMVRGPNIGYSFYQYVRDELARRLGYSEIFCEAL